MWDKVLFDLQQTFSRVFASLAYVVPAAGAMLIAVLIAAIIGIVLRWILVRFLRAVRFDQRHDDWGLSVVAEWSPSRSPIRLVGRVVTWASLLIGVLFGLAALEATLMTTMVSRLIAYLPNVFVAILLLLIGSV